MEPDDAHRDDDGHRDHEGERDHRRNHPRPRIIERMVVTVGPEELTPVSGYEQVARELAFESERAIQIRTRAEGGAATGWHHHGDREVFGYLVRGRARFEFGPGGRESTEIEPGGFFHIPAGIVHRDVNPLDDLQELALVFVGSGPLVVDVDGPEPDA